MTGAAKKVKKSGGRRKGAGRKKGEKNHRGCAGKSPQDFMNALVPAGPRVNHDEPPIEPEILDADFTAEKHYVDPVEFCLAVINGDNEVLARCGITAFPDMDQKLEASRIAVKYTNKAKPVETITKHEHSWMDGITKAEQRVKTLRMDLENDGAYTPETTN
jgi:hypothetical protein